MENADVTYVCSYIIMGIILAVCVIYLIIGTFVRYFRERKYIKMEIERTDGEEKLYWCQELKALDFFLIPIIGPIITKKLRP